MATAEESDSKTEGSAGQPAIETGMFAVSGEYWTLGYRGNTFLLKDLKGLSYIQRLLQHPHEEFHALDLVGASGTFDSERIERHESSLPAGMTFRPGLTGDAGEMLDAQAKQEYKRKLYELNEELADLREHGDSERAEQIESEIEFLEREIKRAVGIGGRDRRAGSAAERARLNITRAVKAALQRISEQQASMGELLECSIKTGSFCSYTPDPRIQVNWRFYAGSYEPPSEAAATEQVFSRRETSFLPAFTGGTTFVGRVAEHAILSRCLEHALKGEGRTVLIGGAAGVGKTRIAAEIGAEALGRGMRAFVGSCYDRVDPIPFIPFVEILEQAVAEMRDRAAFRDALGSDAPELAKLLPRLRRMFPDIPQALELPLEQSRRILFRAISDLIARAARNTPTLFLLDDLQWADEGTLLLLNHLAQLAPEIPFLVVVTYRDFDLDPAGKLSQTQEELIRKHLVERITLVGLSEDAVAEMLRALSGREPPNSVVQLFYSYSEGNPFFVEELFRHLFEQGRLLDPDGEFRRNLKIGDIDVPASVRLLIGLRLARFSESTVKTLRIAAVVGRSFTFELLAASTQLDQDLLLDCVEEAERVGLISSTAQYPEARFRFSHELIRQAVIGRVSPARRQRLHLDVAAAIERLHAHTLEEVANELAHHLWQAGTHADSAKTARFLAMAAKRALEQSAYESALHHMENALALMAKLPDTAERDRWELDLQIDRGVALLATKGWYVREVAEAFQRARELCQRLGEDRRLFPVLFGLNTFHLCLGQHSVARSYSDELTQLAERLQDDAMRLEAHWASGCNLFFIGEFVRAHGSLEKSIALYDRQKHRTLASQIGQDPCVSCLCYDAMTLWMLGYPVRAEKRAQEAISLARELGNPFTLTWCVSQLAMYYSIRRDFSSVDEMLRQGFGLTKEYGFAFWEENLIAYSLIMHAAKGEIEEMKADGIRARKYSEIGYELAQTWARPALAEALANLGRLRAANTLLAEALEIMERNDERYVESEIHRIKGDVLLKQMAVGAHDQPEIQAAESAAERSLLSAIEAARKHDAKMLEMRASISLAGLLIRRERKAEAAGILRETYNWFTEGFETAELTTARALLDGLVSASG